MSQQALVPVEQKQVAFYDDKIVAVQVEDGTIYVPVRPICDALGVNWSGQRQRISRDAVLSEVAMSVGVTHSDIATGSRRPRTSTMLALPLNFLNGFLFGINTNRVKSEIRDHLIRYQRECYQVLADAFQKGVAVAPDPDIDAIIASDPDLSEAYSLAQVALSLIRSHARLKANVDDHEMRLQLIEADLGNTDRYISVSQASTIMQAVKAIALQLGKQSGRNEFGGVYGELYRRFKVNSYEHLPATKFDEAMDFMRQWYTSLIDSESMPF